MKPTIIGGIYLTSSKNYVTTDAEMTYVMPDYSCPGNGVVTSFWAYFVKAGKVQLQIWRRAGGEQDSYELIGRINYLARNASLQEVGSTGIITYNA